MHKAIYILLFTIFASCNTQTSKEHSFSDTLSTKDERNVENIETNIYLNAELTDTFGIKKGNNDVILSYKYFKDYKRASDLYSGLDIYFKIPSLKKIKISYTYNLDNSDFQLFLKKYNSSSKITERDIIAYNIQFLKIDSILAEVKMQVFIKIREKVYNVQFTKSDRIILNPHNFEKNNDSGNIDIIAVLLNDTIEIKKNTTVDTY